MSFDEFIKLTKISLGVKGEPKISVCNRLKRVFDLQRLQNAFIFTGCPSAMIGSVSGYANQQAFFTDYISLYDLIIRKFGSASPTSNSFNVIFVSQCMLLPYGDGALVQDSVRINGVDTPAYSVVGTHVYSVNPRLYNNVWNNQGIVRAYLVEFDNTQILKIG